MFCHIGGSYGMGALLSLLVVGLVAYWLFTKASSNRPSKYHASAEVAGIADTSAMELLNRKYESGEISEAEYLRKKDLLRQYKIKIS